MKLFALNGVFAEITTIFLVLLVISVGFWILIGRFRLHNALINIYIAFAILQAVPANWISMSKFLPLVVFLLLVIFLTAVDSNLFDIHLSGSGLAIWQVILLSFLEAGLFLSIISTLFSPKFLYEYLSKDSILYFTSPVAQIVWMIVPLFFLITVNKRNN